MTLATDLKSPLSFKNGQYQLEAVEYQTAFLTSYRAIALPPQRSRSVSTGESHGVTAGESVLLQTLPVRLASPPAHRDLAVAQQPWLRQQFFAAVHQFSQSSHPQQLQVLDTFEEGDLPYVVLAQPQGMTLAERLQAAGPLPEQEALQIIRQVGEVLIPLHTAGLLHWDIQPQNLLWDAHSQHATLTHLSWARLAFLGDEVPDPQWFAPGYTALEQYLPGMTATPATDIYALAATLYTLLTGQTPIAANHRDRQPLPNPRQFRSDLSPIVEQVILQGMEINPRLRPQDLGQWLALFPQRSRSIVGESRYRTAHASRVQGSSPRPIVLPTLTVGSPVGSPVVSPVASSVGSPVASQQPTVSPTVQFSDRPEAAIAPASDWHARPAMEPEVASAIEPEVASGVEFMAGRGSHDPDSGVPTTAHSRLQSRPIATRPVETPSRRTHSTPAQDPPSSQKASPDTPNVLSLPKLERRLRQGYDPTSSPQPAVTQPAVMQSVAMQSATTQSVATQSVATQPVPKYADDGTVAVPVQSTTVKATIKSRQSKLRSQRAASPPSRRSGMPVSSNSSSTTPPSPAIAEPTRQGTPSPSRFPSNRRLFQGLLVASAAAAFFGGGFGLTLRFAGDRGPMNSRLLQPNQSFPPQAWPGEADAAQFDFSNVPTSGESPRWEDPVTPAQPTWPLEEESAFPPPPVTRAPIAPEAPLAPSEAETGATADLSPSDASPAVSDRPDLPTVPAALSETSQPPSASADLAPEPAPAPIEPPPSAVEPSVAPPAPVPPASSGATGDVAPPPMPMQESRTAHPEELS